MSNGNVNRNQFWVIVANDGFKSIVLSLIPYGENGCIVIQMSVKYVPMGFINP